MHKLILLILVFTQDRAYSFFNPAKLTPQNIISKSELQRDANNFVRTLGMNCANPKGVAQFIKETVRILSGTKRFAAEAGLTLATKPDYPTLCHVLTESHLGTYKEGKGIFTKTKCHSKVAGKCVLKSKTTFEKPRPSYYWPKYFIEVTKKGNDSHPSFAAGNLLHILNRKMADALSSYVDVKSGLKMAGYVMGASTMLSAIGVNTGEAPNESDLMKSIAFKPMQKLRVNSVGSDDSQHFEANIWPVGLSGLFARHFSVCGPIREREGKSPGGYESPIPGIPRTCSTARSSDMLDYWDQGIFDLLDPVAIAAIPVASNPLSCNAAYAMSYLADKGAVKIPISGDTKKYAQKITKFGKKFSQGLTGCSSPLLGSAAQIAKKAMSFADLDKWKEVKCTPWGTIFPRSGRSQNRSDYNFANTALRFKTLSHELFGVPRGEKERWSLAYPFENLPMTDTGVVGKILEKFKLLGKGIKTGRSHGLYYPGDPRMIDTTFSLKHKMDQGKNYGKEAIAIGSLIASGGATSAVGSLGFEVGRQKIANTTGVNISSGDRRIYTIWEEISCEANTKKVEVTVAGQTLVKKYDSCEAAVRFEVYKYIQTKLLRRICDLAGQEVGLPWR